MPVFQCIVKFVQVEEDWSETYFCTADTIQLARAKFDSGFISASLQCRHPLTFMPFVRIANRDQPRQATLFPLQSNAAAVSGVGAEPPRVCAEYRLVCTPLGLRRTLFMRGLRDTDVERDPVSGNDNPSGTLINAAASYFAVLEQRGLQINALMPITKTDPWNFYLAGSLTVDGSNLVTVNWVTLPDLTGFKRCILSRFDPKIWPGLAGHFDIVTPTLTSFKVRYTCRRAPGTYTDGLGQMRIEAYRQGTKTAADCVFRRFASHSTRNAPFSIRGRKRAEHLRYR
jgi:hypothetical protein